MGTVTENSSENGALAACTRSRIACPSSPATTHPIALSPKCPQPRCHPVQSVTLRQGRMACWFLTLWASVHRVDGRAGTENRGVDGSIPPLATSHAVSFRAVDSLRFVALTTAAGRLSMNCPCSCARTVPSHEANELAVPLADNC